MKPASASWLAEPGDVAPVDRHRLPGWAKLATGIAASGLVAMVAHRWHGQALFADLGRPVAEAMLAHGVRDGSVRWTTDNGWTWRIARLAGTADAATRAAVLAEVRRTPGIHDAVWQDRR